MPSTHFNVAFYYFFFLGGGGVNNPIFLDSWQKLLYKAIDFLFIKEKDTFVATEIVVIDRNRHILFYYIFGYYIFGWQPQPKL